MSGKWPTYEGLSRAMRTGGVRRWLRSLWVRREYAPLPVGEGRGEGVVRRDELRECVEAESKGPFAPEIISLINGSHPLKARTFIGPSRDSSVLNYIYHYLPGILAITPDGHR